MKKLDVMAEVALGHSQRIVLRQRQEITIAAGVHGPFFQVIAHGVRFRSAGTAQRVMSTHRICDDLRQHVARGREAASSRNSSTHCLARGSYPRRCSVGNVRRIEEQRVGSLVALQVDDAQSLAAPQCIDPIVAGPRR